MNEKNNKDKLSVKKHPHYGHRKRKKEQFLLSGIDNFPEHEKLELFLFFSIPTGDTNELAHRLINHFGSFTNVIVADREELLEVEGVGEHTASMFTFFKMAARYYIMERKGNLIEFKDTVNLKAYCKALFIEANVEQVYCVFLDDGGGLIYSEKICDGGIGKVEIKLLEMLASIHKAKVVNVVISHNHPNGSSIPSREDVDVTNDLNTLFKKLGLRLIDHVIVGRDGACSMRERDNITELYN